MLSALNDGAATCIPGPVVTVGTTIGPGSQWLDSSQRSQSMAAMQPDPAAVTAWR